jgi:hypothetical protein
MVKKNQCAYGVRVKLNESFEVICLSDTYLKEEKVLFIDFHGVMNDQDGYYVYIRGGSLMNSGTAYLTELDLEFPIPEVPLYKLYSEE